MLCATRSLGFIACETTGRLLYVKAITKDEGKQYIGRKQFRLKMRRTKSRMAHVSPAWAGAEEAARQVTATDTPQFLATQCSKIGSSGAWAAGSWELGFSHQWITTLLGAGTCTLILISASNSESHLLDWIVHSLEIP